MLLKLLLFAVLKVIRIFSLNQNFPFFPLLKPLVYPEKLCMSKLKKKNLSAPKFITIFFLIKNEIIIWFGCLWLIKYQVNFDQNFLYEKLNLLLVWIWNKISSVRAKLSQTLVQATSVCQYFHGSYVAKNTLNRVWVFKNKQLDSKKRIGKIFYWLFHLDQIYFLKVLSSVVRWITFFDYKQTSLKRREKFVKI